MAARLLATTVPPSACAACIAAACIFAANERESDECDAGDSVALVFVVLASEQRGEAGGFIFAEKFSRFFGTPPAKLFSQPSLLHSTVDKQPKSSRSRVSDRRTARTLKRRRLPRSRRVRRMPASFLARLCCCCASNEEAEEQQRRDRHEEKKQLKGRWSVDAERRQRERVLDSVAHCRMLSV